MERPADLHHNPGFRRFWSAFTISGFGSAVTVVALGVLIVDHLGGTATDVGLVQSASMAPYLVVGLFVGVLADRMRRKPLLVGSDLGRAVVLAGVPLLAVAGTLNVPLLAGLMAVFGLLSVVNAAAQQSFLPRLVHRELLHRANARLEQSGALAQTTGPLLGGGLIAAVGAPLAVLADAVSYAVSGLLIAATPVTDPRPQPARRSVLADLREGARWVYRHRTLRPLALSTHGWFLFNAVATTAYIPFALSEIGLGPGALGVTFALAGIGSLLGSSISEGLSRRVGIPATVIGSRLLEAAGVAVIATAAATTSFPVVMAAAGQFLYGLGMGAEGPIEMSYRQTITPDRLQGRMNATMRSLNRAAVVAGAPLGGLFADAAGLRPALWLGSAGLAASGLFLARSGFSTASHHDQPPPD